MSAVSPACNRRPKRTPTWMNAEVEDASVSRGSSVAAGASMEGRHKLDHNCVVSTP